MDSTSRLRRISSCLSLGTVALLLALPAAEAGAKLTVRASIAGSGDAARLTVGLTNAKPFTAKTRPRTVSVKAGGKTYKLRHVAGTASARTAAAVTSRWQSQPSAALARSVGKKVRVRVGTRAGTTRFSVTATQESSGSNTGGNTGTPTQDPGTGGNTGTPTQDPQTRFLTMFNNSGWDRPHTTTGSDPVTTEDLYNFCANNMYFERFTGSVSEYQYQGSWQLQGPVQTGVVSGYNVVEGTVGTTDQDGAHTTLYVDLSEQLPNSAYINQKEFTRVTPQTC